MGVTKEIISDGDGKNFPSTGDSLTMHYTGTLAVGGDQFDSSHKRGKPFKFTIGIGQVIQGKFLFLSLVSSCRRFHIMLRTKTKNECHLHFFHLRLG